MDKRDAILVLYTLASFTVGGFIGERYSWTWTIVMLSAGVAFGALSLLVYARRLMFIAAASPHAGFFAAMVSVPLAYTLGGPVDAWMTLIALLLVYFAAALVYYGLDPDEATSVFVSLSASGGVLAAYLVLTRYPAASQVWASLVGDPLLASRLDTVLAVSTALVFAVLAYLTAREIVYSGLDPEDARLSGLRTWAYEALIYTFIALIVVVMVRIVGFVLEHVLILLPGVIAGYSSRGLYKTLTYSIFVSADSTLLGLGIAVATNTSPSAMAGLTLFTVFLVVLLARR